MTFFSNLFVKGNAIHQLHEFFNRQQAPEAGRFWKELVVVNR